MDQGSKRRSRPVPDAINMKPIAFNLEEALSVENIYRPNLLVINQSELKPWEVTLSSRDGAVQILRFLRVWFDLSHDVFFTAVSYLDMFLSRMKVQQKHLKCVTISCFYLAAAKDNIKIDTKQLVMIIQNKCTVKDMLRMTDIVKEKLKLNNTGEGNKPTTAADFLKLYLEIFEYMTRQWNRKIISLELLQKQQLLTRLEVILTDSTSAYFRSSTLALVLIQIELEKFMAQELPSRSVYFLGEMLHLLAVIRELQHTCKIKTAELKNCYLNISKVLKMYDSHHKTKHCEEMSWRFSTSTIDKAYRHRNFHTYLSPISERENSY